MKTIRTAVIGVGYLGAFHAQKFHNLPNSKLVAVCDTQAEQCQKIATLLETEAVLDYRTLVGKVDAVSVVVPTALHHEITCFFLKHGIHVLVEKPIASTIEEAEEMVDLAQKNNLILQVGHLERFNSTIKMVEPFLKNPRFIESVRLAPFRLRGTDINVILDLMIHDIDIIQSMTHSEIHHIAANGAPVLSPYIDIATARIEFKNGCVANVTASRVSQQVERKLRVFQPDCLISMDLNQQHLSIHKKGTKEMFPGIPEIITQNKHLEKNDPLNEEIQAFLNSIINQTPAIVSGLDGLRALKTAIRITDIVRESNEAFPLVEASVSETLMGATH